MTDLRQLAQTVRANQSPRFAWLDKLERFVETTQYDDRPWQWLDGSEDAPPLLERRPCIAYPIVRTAIDSNVDLCLGEGKFPTVTISDFDDGEGANEEKRESVDEGLSKLADIAKLKPGFRSAFAAAQGQKSVAVICGSRAGSPFVEVEKAKRCTPTFDADGNVTALDIRYVYIVDEKDAQGRWTKEAKLYRRLIDSKSDTTFAPVDARPDGAEPKQWPVQSRVDHNLGFCPVVWYKHMAGCTTAGDIDGRAIHEHHLDEIEALDVALSQWHRAAFFAGDPQIYEIGVDSGSGPMARGRSAFINPSGAVNPLSADGSSITSTASGGEASRANPVNGSYPMGNATASRRKSPGTVWTYGNPDAKVGMMTLPGDALKAISDHCRDLREKVAEGLGVVFSDPDTVRFASALSGKAQQMLRQRQLDRCDQYRDDMCDGLILPVIRMLVRIMRVVPPKSAVLRKLVSALATMGDDPGYELRWGTYYEPDPDDQAKLAKFLAEVDKVIPLPDRIKLQKLARALDIENVQALLDEIEEEREARQERSRAEAESGANALLSAAHGSAVGIGNPAGARGSAPKDAGGRGGVAPAAAKAQPANRE